MLLQLFAIIPTLRRAVKYEVSRIGRIGLAGGENGKGLVCLEDVEPFRSALQTVASVTSLTSVRVRV